jgi:sRNA-binding protein
MSRHRLDLRKATIAFRRFYVARRQRRPLKIGSATTWQRSTSGQVGERLDSALAWYVNGISYLQSLRVDAVPIGLDGAPAGIVAEGEEARTHVS